MRKTKHYSCLELGICEKKNVIKKKEEEGETSGR